MLKQVFGLFEITESQITESAIKRLKWASIISFFLVPLVAILHLFQPFNSPGTKSVILALAYISILGFFIFGFSRALNRLWIPDRYLDESEISRKREVNHFAFVWLITGVMIAGFALIVLDSLGVNSPGFMSDPKIMFFSLALVCVSSLSLQGLKLSKVLTPITDEERTEDSKHKDKIYLICVYSYIIGVLVVSSLFKHLF